jgi:hypothetical protein
MLQCTPFLVIYPQPPHPVHPCYSLWNHSIFDSFICIAAAAGERDSVATVMTDIFQKNEINLLRKFAKIMIIFGKIDDSKNQGVIQRHQSFGDVILELLNDN